jgi:hypothetical protein
MKSSNAMSSKTIRSIVTGPRILAAAFAIAAGVALAAAPVRAQMSDTPPIVVKQKPVKQTWLNAVVIHADNNSIMVHDAKNSLNILTFTYSAALRDKMQKILDNGGYQSGDKVRILYEPGKTEAVNIRGKPSKPL